MTMTMLSILFATAVAVNPQPQMVVSTEWLAANIDQPNVLVLDVSTMDQYKRGHIPGAVLLNSRALMVRHANIPDELPSVTRLEELFRDAGVQWADRIILTSDDPLLATRAWFTLDYLGWGDRAAILDGGNNKWTLERHHLTPKATAAKKGDFSARPDPSTVISRDQLRTMLDTNEPFVLLDARPTKQYLGHQKGAEVKRAGHIPTAECLPWTSNTSMQKGFRTLRTPNELANIYSGMNITTENERIVVYCRTGVEASMNYFVLRYLGFHPSLYDGSYVEWNKAEKIVGELK